MDEVRAAWDAWDAARGMVRRMFDRDDAALDVQAYEMAEVTEYMARRQFYRAASDHFGVRRPFDVV